MRLSFHGVVGVAAFGLGLGCSSEDDPGGRQTTDSGAEAAGAAGGSGGSGGGAAGGDGGSGGSAGTTDASVDVSPDVGADSPVDVVGDPFADAPDRPGPTEPMAIVLYGSVDGMDLTGLYDATETSASPDVCGVASLDGGTDAGAPAAFRFTRRDPTGGATVTIRYADSVGGNPPVAEYDELDAWNFTVSRVVRVDGSLRQITFRAGQTIPDSDLVGDVFAEDLDATGMLDARFHVTKAQRFVTTDEGVKDADLWIFVTGTCK